MRIKRTLFFILAIFIFTSCNKNDIILEEVPYETEEAVPVMAEVKEIPDSYLDVLYEKTIKTSIYEPTEGCYLGAYILSDKTSDFDIKKFEEITNKEHALYTYYTKLNSTFPTEWILKCISNMKTPNIFIYPETKESPYNLEQLETAAKKYGEFYVPVFLHFYPVDTAYNPKEYIEFYQNAREIFREHASNVAFVWTVDEEYLPIMNQYYPGDDYVDYVGVSIAKSIGRGEAEFQSYVMDKIDHIYFAYQDIKPIMVSNLSISHFSGFNNMYFTTEAGEEIEHIYNEIIENYPRIKAVNYVSYNGLDPVNQMKGKDNYSVTDNDNIVDYYKNAIADDKFLSLVDFSAGEDEVKAVTNSLYRACSFKGEYYIPEGLVKNEIKNESLNNISEFKEFDDNKYYNLSMLKKLPNVSVEIDSAGDKVLIRLSL